MGVQLLRVHVTLPRIEFYSEGSKLCDGKGGGGGVCWPYLTIKTTEACYEIHLRSHSWTVCLALQQRGNRLL
jgi:hypothetical protein